MSFMSRYTDAERERAQKRFVWLQIARLASLAAVIVGIAMAREVLPGPYALGVALAVGGMLAFFFAPPLLARRFKARDGKLPERMNP